MKRVGFAALSLIVSGCMVGPDFIRPKPPQVEKYTREDEPKTIGQTQGPTQRLDQVAEVPSKWWNLFHASKLDPLVSRALQNNFNVQTALANLRQSQANLQAGYGVFFPRIDGTFGASREKTNPRSFGVNVPGNIFNIFTLSADVSYALDIFGGSRRALEGLKAQVEAQNYAVLAAYLTLTGNVVNTLIARAAYQAQIESTQSLIAVQKEQMEITSAQVKAGTLPYVNLLSLQSQLSALEATLPPLKQKLSQSEHLLATLSGQTPSEWSAPEIKLTDFTLPESLPRTLPSMLVRQRPDILQAESLLHLSSAQVGVATAAMFPSLTITGNAGLTNTAVNGLLDTKSSVWGFGANLTAPIFHGGTLRAQKQAAVEAYEASFAVYKQTVLNAFSQVADVLRALENDSMLVTAQNQSLKAASESLKLVQANYVSGTADYLQLLVANSQLHQAKIGYDQAIAQRLQDTAQLFLVLGGGWTHTQDAVSLAP